MVIPVGVGAGIGGQRASRFRIVEKLPQMAKTFTASQRCPEQKPSDILVSFCNEGDEADQCADLVAPWVPGVGAASAVRNVISGGL